MANTDNLITKSLDYSRVKKLNNIKKPNGDCVIYVMSREQRVQDNHTFLFAQKHARELKVPLAVVFCLQSKAGHRARAHFQWVIEGLKEVEKNLDDYNVPFLLLFGKPEDRLKAVEKHTNPAAVYFDFSPLNGQKKLRELISKNSRSEIFVVDSHNIVPVWVASSKQEFSARTIRSKIQKQLDKYLVEPPKPQKQLYKWPGKVMRISDLKNRLDDHINNLDDNLQYNLSKIHPPGSYAGQKKLREFIDSKLHNYSANRNDPNREGLSDLSPYLHFGAISSLRVALEINNSLQVDSSLQQSADAFLEEIIIRKELSDNYCFYNSDYKTIEGAPDWAKETLGAHRNDNREFIYTLRQFEQAETHDPAWNAAQLQMERTGKMHGYMRMYWAKKVLEWTRSPEEAIEILIYLNDYYSIDGCDPNGYVGILWSVAGLHDRPWGERLIYGKVRSMVYDGLKRKFDIEKFIAQNLQ